MMDLALEALEKVHPSDKLQRCKLLALHCVDAPSQWQHLDFDRVCGEGGSLMAELTQNYEYERMHVACKWLSFDWVVGFPKLR